MTDVLQWARSSDNFSSTLSAQWVRRNGGTNPLTSSGVLTTTAAAGFYPAEFIARPTRGPDQYCAVTIAALHPGSSGGMPSPLILRAPNNATSGTVVCAFVKNNQIGIYTMTSWAGAGLTVRTAYANSNGGSNMALGSRVAFYVHNNVYTATYNGATVVTWNDSGAVASQTGRYGAVAMQYENDGSANGVMSFDDWTFGDYRPFDVATPMQSMNRAASF